MTKKQIPHAKDITELEGLIPKLNASGQSFARSLCRQFKQRGLTVRQEPYVFKLIEQAKNPPKPATKKLRGDMVKLYRFFLSARKHLKYPKIIIHGEFGGGASEDLKLHLSGEKSRQPDTVNITLPDRVTSNGRSVWLGRIGVDGAWDIPPHLSNDGDLISTVKDTLVQLGNDPHKVASAHGKFTGNCCFCNRHLEDDRSTGVGYGPVCAEKWGLKQQWRAGAGVDSVKASAAPKRKVRASKGA